jgi:hypothetical protein
MSIITPPASQAKPIEFDGFIDTAVIFLPCRYILQAEHKRLREAYGAKPNITTNDTLGYMLIPVQCPQPNVLGVFNELEQHYEGTLNRLDLSFEARPDPLMSPDEQMREIKAHLFMPHRNAGPVLEIKNDRDPINNGTFIIPHAHTNGSPRDICLYTDLPSKLHPSNPRVAKFDLRLRGKRGFGQIERDLMQCRPDEMALRHIGFVDYDLEQFKRRLFRDALKGRTIEEGRRLISHYKRSWNEPEHQFEYAMRIHDWYPGFDMGDGSHLFKLPNTLTWGATRRSMTDKGQKTVGDETSRYQSDTNEQDVTCHIEHARSSRIDQTKRRPKQQKDPSPRIKINADRREREHLDARQAMNRERLARVGKLSPLSPRPRKESDR